MSSKSKHTAGTRGDVRPTKKTKTTETIQVPPVLFREREILQLKNLLESSTLKYPVYVYGTAGSGKSRILHAIQAESDHLLFAVIDCQIFQTEADIVQQVFSQLGHFFEGNLETVENDRPIKSRSTIAEIKKLLSASAEESDATDDALRSVIVLDGIDYLRKTTDLLNSFISLLRDERITTTLVLAARSPWRNVIFGGNIDCDALEVHVKSYSKTELVDIVFQMFESSGIKDDMLKILQSYCQLIVDTYYPVTKDVRQHRAQAQRHYSSFMAPLTSGRLKSQQSQDMFKIFLPLLSKDFHGIKSISSESKLRESSSITMPRYLRFLLIAAYLCSYNASQADARMVAKRHDRVRKEKQMTARKKAKDKRFTVLGPQPFNFERLCSNFYSLTTDHDVKLCLMQIQANLRTLCGMKLVIRVGQEESLDNPKFKCVCEKECVRMVATSVDLDLNRYLIDLV